MRRRSSEEKNAITARALSVVLLVFGWLGFQHLRSGDADEGSTNRGLELDVAPEFRSRDTDRTLEPVEVRPTRVVTVQPTSPAVEPTQFSPTVEREARQVHRSVTIDFNEVSRDGSGTVYLTVENGRTEQAIGRVDVSRTGFWIYLAKDPGTFDYTLSRSFSHPPNGPITLTIAENTNELGNSVLVVSDESGLLGVIDLFSELPSRASLLAESR